MGLNNEKPGTLRGARTREERESGKIQIVVAKRRGAALGDKNGIEFGKGERKTPISETVEGKKFNKNSCRRQGLKVLRYYKKKKKKRRGSRENNVRLTRIM